MRKASLSTVIRRLRDETASVPGVSLYMQPVQDLTLDNTLSRTQYQFTLESADQAALSAFTPKLISALQQKPELADVVSNPIHATGVGLLLYARQQAEQDRTTPLLTGGVKNIFDRMKTWFQGNF